MNNKKRLVSVIHANQMFSPEMHVVARFVVDQDEVGSQGVPYSFLDYVFTTTNTIEDAWYELQRDKTTESVKLKGGARSLSMEDIVVIDGNAYRVEMAGWQEMDLADLVSRINEENRAEINRLPDAFDEIQVVETLVKPPEGAKSTENVEFDLYAVIDGEKTWFSTQYSEVDAMRIKELFELRASLMKTLSLQSVVKVRP